MLWIRFVRNGFSTMILTLFYLEIHAERYIFFKQEDSVLYSNVSNENFFINHKYFIFFENLYIVNVTCNIICPSIQFQENQSFILNFHANPFKFQEDILLTVNIYIDSDYNSSCVINITFIDKLDDIIYNCPNESYFTTEDKGYRPLCTFKWCLFRNCSYLRSHIYFDEITLWDIDKDQFINELYPYDNKSTYHLKVTRSIYVRSDNRLVGHLFHIAIMYLIDNSKYICNNHTGGVILVNTLELFTLECNLTSDIPFLDDRIKLQMGSRVYSKWYMKQTHKMDSKYYIKPRTSTQNHIISFSSGRNDHILKEIRYFFYVKIGTSLCNNGRIYVVNTLDNFTCFDKHPYPRGFYIKIQNLSNQISQSIQINSLDCQVLKTWIPETVTKLRGKMFIKDMETNTNENEREIMDFRMSIRKSVIRNLKILPESMSINLPDEISVSCKSGGVRVVSYIWTLNNFSRSVNGCSYSINLPQLNFTVITVFVAVQYEYYWYNISKVYLIGRIPTIVIISSKFPKLSQNVLCNTDGENKLYTFHWICNDSNEPKDLVAVDYITSNDNDLIFHETAPMITYSCMCLSTYRDVFGRQIFAISADVDLNLQINEMIDCELAKTMMDEATWTIFVIYVLIYFMIPSVFFLIAYFVTDGRIKSMMQSKVFNKLGFINETYQSAEPIPYFIIAKTDVGDKPFNHFLVRILDLDKTIEALRLFRQASFQFRFSKRISNDSERKMSNMNEAKTTLFRLMSRHEDLYKQRSSQWMSSKFESSTSERSNSPRSITILKRLDHVSIDKNVDIIPHSLSKPNYMSSFGKNSERKINKSSVSLRRNKTESRQDSRLTQPRVARKSFKSVSDGKTIERFRRIIGKSTESENLSSIQKSNTSTDRTITQPRVAIKTFKSDSDGKTIERLKIMIGKSTESENLSSIRKSNTSTSKSSTSSPRLRRQSISSTSSPRLRRKVENFRSMTMSRFEI